MFHSGHPSHGISVPVPSSPRRNNVSPVNRQYSSCPNFLHDQNTQTSCVSKLAAHVTKFSLSRYLVTGNSKGSRLTCRSSGTLPLPSSSFMPLLSSRQRRLTRSLERIISAPTLSLLPAQLWHTQLATQRIRRLGCKYSCNRHHNHTLRGRFPTGCPCGFRKSSRCLCRFHKSCQSFTLLRSECASRVACDVASPRPAALAVDVFLLVPVRAVRAAS